MGAIAGECGIPGKALGTIEVGEESSTIEAPARYAPDILKGMQGKKIKKTAVSIKVINS